MKQKANYKMVVTSSDFCDFFSALMSDVVAARIPPEAASAACRAGRNILGMIQYERQVGRTVIPVAFRNAARPIEARAKPLRSRNGK